MFGIDRRLAVVWYPAFTVLTAATVVHPSQLFGISTSMVGTAALLTFFGWGGVVNVADDDPWVALGFFLMAVEFAVSWSAIAVPGGAVTIYAVTSVAVFLILLGDRFDEFAITDSTGPVR